MKRTWYLLCFLFPVTLHAQVQHNFDKEPANTDCHLIDGTLPADSLAIQIGGSTFRLAEDVRISRYSDPRALSFRSCDGATGYLIVDHGHGVTVYESIPHEEWQELLDSEDIRSAYAAWQEHHHPLK